MKKILLLVGTLLLALSAPFSAQAASPGQWSYDLHFPWPNSPSGLGYLNYNLFLPPQWVSTQAFPIVMTGGGDGQSMEGSHGYPTPGAQFVGNTLGKDLSTPMFQTAHPSIIVSTECDQSAGSSAGGNANCGGYGDGVMTGWNEQAINGLLAYLLTQYKVPEGGRLCVGMSLSAIGCLAELVDNNSANHVGSGLWDAGFLMSTQLTRPGIPNSSTFPKMGNVLIVSVCSPGDNACNWDGPFCQYLGGSCSKTKTDYDNGGMAAVRASSTACFYYISSTNGGTAYGVFGPMNGDPQAPGGDGTAAYNVLFSSVGTGVIVPPPPPPPPPSPNDTVVLAGSGGTITDAAGSAWGISSGGQVVLNGNTISGTKLVAELAYVSGVVWQEASGGNWYNFTPAGTYGGTTTTTSPLPPGPPPPPPPPAETLSIVPIAPVQTVGTPWTITGNIGGETTPPALGYKDGGATAWTPLPSGAIVTPTTFSFVHPAVSTAIASVTTSVEDTATNVGATSNSYAVVTPPPPPPPPTGASLNNTVVLAGSGASITDAAGNVWTISPGGETLENGIAPAFSSNVASIAYVSKIVFQQNTQNQWYAWNGTTWLGGPNPFSSSCAYNPVTSQITCVNAPPQ